MKFYDILKDVILEDSRMDFLSDKFTKPSKGKKPLLDPEQLFALVVADPKTKVEDGVDIDNFDGDFSVIQKVGPYAQWIIKQFLGLKSYNDSGRILEPKEPNYEKFLDSARRLFFEDLIKVTQNLIKFDRFKGRLNVEDRNIDKLSLEKLDQIVSHFSLEKERATREEKSKAAQTYEHPGADIVFRSPKWTIAKVSRGDSLGRDAACYYGGNMLRPVEGETGWCTSPPGYERNFHYYISKGPLYVIIPNQSRTFRNYGMEVGRVSKLPADRFQFHFPDDQFMDAADEQIDLVEFLNENPELKEFFKPEFAKGLTNLDSKTLKIDNFNHGKLARWISLYGLDEIFNNLPDTLTQIKIKQPSGSDKVDLKIPRTIGRFKNLEHLILVNCISELPDYICELEKLAILGVMENSELTNIPECVVTIPSLNFINFKNCPVQNVEFLLENGWDSLGDGMWDKFSQEDSEV